MSPSARRVGRTLGVIGLGLLALLAGLSAWAWLPWRTIDGLVVERAALLAPGVVDGSRKPATLATPVRIVAIFSVPEDLVTMRDRLGITFIAARLASCADPERETAETITQKVEYHADHGRVTRMAAQDGRARYRAVFDDRLDWQTGPGRSESGPARAEAPLCLRLEGGNMFYGPARSATVPLPPLR